MHETHTCCATCTLQRPERHTPRQAVERVTGHLVDDPQDEGERGVEHHEPDHPPQPVAGRVERLRNARRSNGAPNVQHRHHTVHRTQSSQRNTKDISNNTTPAAPRHKTLHHKSANRPLSGLTTPKEKHENDFEESHMSWAPSQVRKSHPGKKDEKRSKQLVR